MAQDHPAPVYNLSVEGEQEYFANGVLVHNCDGAKGLASRFVVPAAGLNSNEEREERLPEHLRAESIAELEGVELQQALMTAQHMVFARTDEEDLQLRAAREIASFEQDNSSSFGW